MKFLWVFVLTMACVLDLEAFPNFVTNPYTLIPPGCATLPQQQSAIYGENASEFFNGRIYLQVAGTRGERRAVNLAISRVACAEPGQSIIRLAFTIPQDVGPWTVYETPRVFAEWGADTRSGMSLLPDTGTWGAGIEPWYYPQAFGGYDDWGGESGYDKTWTFLLDNWGPAGSFTYTSGIMPSARYNRGFRLRIGAALPTGEDLLIAVPTTAESIEAADAMPLNGRLSGTWVVDGVPDQGFVVAVSEFPSTALPEPNEIVGTRLVFFLSWYAFDGDGAPIWLTGNADFSIGATQVTVPIIRVTGGALFGGKAAERQKVGSATLSANSCNDLTFDYDLTAIGLGAGRQRLQRLYAMEIAGYACRDLEARMQTM